ncbi:hypothetical protein N7499_005100 [Penicillium canescens]|uniref:Uncharacterized protein n=1 Tax=Penicillium canescens TaxID=5083 RepID=A0AAD6N3C4_PENCN|nr:hypothetical protein N7460_011812 [Penicillium canescens]KAJ6040280.1 hypothetical protein N7444_009185 [Penicillium canescens]KAJ6085471.1 hypothetical protein N7499_005100 [Penicillium canescens]KAJ6162249.1 hypothetical protein N7485_010479 [Penicillium canescens]
MAQIIKAVTPPTTAPIKAPRLDAAPELMDADDGAAVLTWLTPRTEDNPVTRVAPEVVETVDVAEVVGVSAAVSVPEVVVVSELVDEGIAGSIVDDVDEDVVTDETSGIPIFAVTAVNPATDVAPGTEVLEVSSLS